MFLCGGDDDDRQIHGRRHSYPPRRSADLDIAEEEINENVRFIKKCENEDENMLKGMFGLHASFTLSDETLKKCQEAMHGLGVGYHVHIAEGIGDLNDSLKKYGKRVVERLSEFGILAAR